MAITCCITPPITLAQLRIRTCHVQPCKLQITEGENFQGYHNNQRHTVTSCPMPPKRPLQSNNEMSPPPSQRQAADQEHHLSPMAGHHPDIPANAAMAIISPPRRLDITNGEENHSPPNSQSGAGQVARTTDDLANRPISSPQQNPSAIDTGRSAIANGGARAAYAAAQQQRIITCNLSNIPTSTA